MGEACEKSGAGVVGRWVLREKEDGWERRLFFFSFPWTISEAGVGKMGEKGAQGYNDSQKAECDDCFLYLVLGNG